MKNPKIATDEKPAPKVKTEQPVAAVLTETTKPKKQDSTQKSSNKPKTVAPKPVPEAKAGQSAVSIAAEAKPEKASLAKKPAKNTQIEATKPALKPKTEQPIATVITEAKPKMPKTVAPKPVPEAKAEQLVLSTAEGAKPKKATTNQKSPKKSKAAPPKAVVPASETATPEHPSLPSDNIWPNWVENLLVSFGIKKK
jgi:hypothetical protein